jgi:hypothetical protein
MAKQETERARHFSVRRDLVGSTHMLITWLIPVCVHMGACVTAYSPVVDHMVDTGHELFPPSGFVSY